MSAGVHDHGDVSARADEGANSPPPDASPRVSYDAPARGPALEIFNTFTFESAHWLPNVPPEHKCRRMHGHSYRVEIHVQGPVGDTSGWVMDFADIRGAFAPLHAALDHRVLNDVEGLDNPTSENLARWIWDRLKPTLPQLAKVVVRETCTSGCAYAG